MWWHYPAAIIGAVLFSIGLGWVVGVLMEWRQRPGLKNHGDE